MTADQMARGYIRRARMVLREAQRLHADEAWNLVVRRCQEVVELALKGALRAAGVEVPKVHDVGGTLRRNLQRLPPHLAAEIDVLVSASRRLREERELAFYGDEETGTEAELRRLAASDGIVTCSLSLFRSVLRHLPGVQNRKRRGRNSTPLRYASSQSLLCQRSLPLSR